MTKGHRPSRVRRLGLDGKQKAQIAVAEGGVCVHAVTGRGKEEL